MVVQGQGEGTCDKADRFGDHVALGCSGQAFGSSVSGADIAMIVTNGRVTASAAAFAKQQCLHMIDRRTLGSCVRAACLSVGRGCCPRLRRKGVPRP
ncbi:hypothetical protein ACFYWO_00925 [Streptomyces sp. NPDC002932]|uniref:hypothetical protein n=1 Tax=Streptomyces sp. NPDC002932 TaxID=3364672 RepID=UPI0036CC1794